LQMVSETYYRVQSLTIELNRFSAKMHKVIHEPSQATQAINQGPMGVTVTVSEVMEDMEQHVEEENDDAKHENLGIPLSGSSIPLPRAASRVGSRATSRRPSVVLKDETSVDYAITKLHMEIVEKMLRVRFSIVRDCKAIFNKTNPVDLGYSSKKKSFQWTN